MIRHFVHAHQFLFLAGVTLAWLSGIFGPLVIRRKRHQKIKTFVDLFDPGTANLDDDSRNYLVSGLFHGRAASVSAERSFFGQTKVSVTGNFYLPFEVRSSRGHWRERIVSIPRTNASRAYGVLFCGYIWSWASDFRTPLWKSCGVVLAIYIAMKLVIYPYGKLMDYFEESATPVCEVQLAGLGILPFETWRPAKFCAAMDRPEIRDSMAHLLDTCHPDSLKAPSDARVSVKHGQWNFSVRAAWFGRDKLLNKEMVGRTLAGLSALCADVEQAFPDTTKLIRH